MPAQYSKLSPYFTTERFGAFLDVLKQRPITKNASDVKFTINAIYQYRPDLLANDLYGDPALWWVFAMRNPNIIKDPIFDFKAGRTIFIPKSDNLMTALGI
jgi:hypothetical protein